MTKHPKIITVLSKGLLDALNKKADTIGRTQSFVVRAAISQFCNYQVEEEFRDVWMKDPPINKVKKIGRVSLDVFPKNNVPVKSKPPKKELKYVVEDPDDNQEEDIDYTII